MCLQSRKTRRVEKGHASREEGLSPVRFIFKHCQTKTLEGGDPIKYAILNTPIGFEACRPGREFLFVFWVRVHKNTQE